MHAVRGSSLQIGALRVAKAVSALEDHIELDDVARRFKRLRAEFKRFVSVFREYLSDGCASEGKAATTFQSPELVKSKSDEVGSTHAVAEKDLLSKSM